jgi:hypothetical protein
MLGRVVDQAAPHSGWFGMRRGDDKGVPPWNVAWADDLALVRIAA